MFTSLKCNEGVVRPLQLGKHNKEGTIPDITIGDEDQDAKNCKFKTH